MSAVIVDDHFLRDLLTGQATSSLTRHLGSATVYTTNLWYLRLCRSIAASAGGRLTGVLTQSQRQALGRQLVALPSSISIVPLADLAWEMAERHAVYPLSALSCEALAAAERLDAAIYVWQGDDGPHLRGACLDRKVSYRTIP